MSNDKKITIKINENSSKQDKENLAKVLNEHGREVTKLKRKNPKGESDDEERAYINYKVEGDGGAYRLQYSLVKLFSEKGKEGKEVWAAVSYVDNKEKYKKGEGSFGSVYKIKNIVEYTPNVEVPITIKGVKNNRYALKRFEKQYPHFEQAPGQIHVEKKESEISKQLFDDVYSNMITLHEGKTRFHLLMPLLKKTLKKVKDDNLNSTQQATLALASLKALQHFRKETKHNHNDIKPENLMLTAKNQVTLIDFGTASEFDSAPVSGTARYMAPDALLGMSQAQNINWGLADVFSMGVTLGEVFGYKVLTNTRKENREMVSPNQPIIWPSKEANSHLDKCAQEQLTILKKMTEMDPDKRISLDEAIRRYEIVVSKTQVVMNYIEKLNKSLTPEVCLEVFNALMGGIKSKDREKNEIYQNLYDRDGASIKGNQVWPDAQGALEPVTERFNYIVRITRLRILQCLLFTKDLKLLTEDVEGFFGKQTKKPFGIAMFGVYNSEEQTLLKDIRQACKNKEPTKELSTKVNNAFKVRIAYLRKHIQQPESEQPPYTHYTKQ